MRKERVRLAEVARADSVRVPCPRNRHGSLLRSNESFTKDLILGPVDVGSITQARAGQFTVGDATPPAVVPILAAALASQILDVFAFALPHGCRIALARQVRGVLGM